MSFHHQPIKIFLILLVLSFGVNSIGIKCGSCKCRNTWDHLTEAYCSTSVFVTGLKEIPDECDKSVNILNFSGQSFKALNNNHFNTFDNLQKIIFKNNKIEVIQQNTFINLPNLTEINLSLNKINVLPDNIFKDLYKIKTIDLSYNKISFLQKNLFTNLTKLEVIKFTLNNIQSIDVNCFTNLRSLRLVDLSNNQLTKLDSSVISNLRKIQYFHLDGNPFHCNEDICPLLNLVSTETLKLSTCASPENLKRQTWTSLNTESIISKYYYEVEEGKTARLDCKHCFPHKLKWDRMLRPHKVVSEELYTSTLLLTNVTKNDTGYYSCYVENCLSCNVQIKYLNVVQYDEEMVNDEPIQKKDITVTVNSTSIVIVKDAENTFGHNNSTLLITNKSKDDNELNNVTHGPTSSETTTIVTEVDNVSNSPDPKNVGIPAVYSYSAGAIFICGIIIAIVVAFHIYIKKNKQNNHYQDEYEHIKILLDADFKPFTRPEQRNSTKTPLIIKNQTGNTENNQTEDQQTSEKKMKRQKTLNNNSASAIRETVNNNTRRNSQTEETHFDFSNVSPVNNLVSDDHSETV